MPKLNISDTIPDQYDVGVWARLLRAIENSVNSLAEGALYGRYAALTAAPTTGSHAKGDIVWNSSPAEAGAGGSKYVTIGWVCTTAGTPGTFKELRCLTGN